MVFKIIIQGIAKIFCCGFCPQYHASQHHTSQQTMIYYFISGIIPIINIMLNRKFDILIR